MSSLSDIYREHCVSHHHIAPLDFNSLSVVPDSHAWPRLEQINGVGIVPVIDLSDKNSVKLLGSACETWGAFQIINHGISTRLLEDVEFQCRRFFSLPTQHKCKALRSPDGVTGYGLPRISPFFSKIMWHEGFTIVGSPKEHAHKLWPNDYTKFCDVFEDYQKEMKTLGEQLITMIFEYLGIKQEELEWKNKNPTTVLQLNSYPACPEPDRALGLVPHTDTSLLTILNETNTSGLQIHKHRHGWVTLSPQAGALTVNVGDFLHILSNARFPSALHRVIVNKVHHRLSSAYFYCPPINAHITPIDRNKDHCYRSVSCSEFLSLKANHLEDAISFIRL